MKVLSTEWKKSVVCCVRAAAPDGKVWELQLWKGRGGSCNPRREVVGVVDFEGWCRSCNPRREEVGAAALEGKL